MAELFLYKTGPLRYRKMMLTSVRMALMAALALFPACVPAMQQRLPNPPESAPPTPPYAEYADLVVAAPVIIDATVRSEARLKPAEAPDLPPDAARLYLEADVLALIRGSGAVPTRIGYTIDVKLDERGKPPRYRKARVLLFARAVAGNIGQIQLVRPDAQRAWTTGGEALTRRIVREVLASDAAPVVTGIANAFHTAGALPGEGETQVFLTTPGGRPVSLNVERRQNQPPHWTIALSEVVTDALPPPPRDTLLWYRFACTLPPALPDSLPSFETASAEDSAGARADYKLVIETLGTCDRGGGF